MLLTSKLSLTSSNSKLESDMDEYNSLSGVIQNSGKGKVICRGQIFRGVRISIGSASIDINYEINSSSFSLVDGKIVTTPVSSY
jgi:uncharacterized protein (DUF342 family)